MSHFLGALLLWPFQFTQNRLHFAFVNCLLNLPPTLGVYSCLAIPKMAPTLTSPAPGEKPLHMEYRISSEWYISCVIIAPYSWVRTVGRSGNLLLNFLRSRLIQSILLKAIGNLQKTVPWGNNNPLHSHMKKRSISLSSASLSSYLSSLPPSVARSVYGFLGSLFRLLCSRGQLGFMFTLNRSDFKSCSVAPGHHPFHSATLTWITVCALRYDFS